MKLTGILDEDNALGALVEKVGSGRALINLAGVERINSTGTRDWVNWLARLEAKGAQLELVACSPAVVAQLNLVKNFAGKGTVKSFQVPYYCSTCDVKKSLLVNVADMGGAPPYKPPPCYCDKCESPMAFDDMPGAYFAFLATLPRVKPSDSGTPSSLDLARGSNAQVKPRLATRSSASSITPYPLPVRTAGSAPRLALERLSQRDITHPRPKFRSEGPYVIIIVTLLLGAIGVFVALLMRS